MVADVMTKRQANNDGASAKGGAISMARLAKGSDNVAI